MELRGEENKRLFIVHKYDPGLSRWMVGGRYLSGPLVWLTNGGFDQRSANGVHSSGTLRKIAASPHLVVYLFARHRNVVGQYQFPR